MKHCFLINSAFLVSFCVNLAFICERTVRQRAKDFQLISGQKGRHYLGGDKWGRESRQTRTKGDKGKRVKANEDKG